MTDCETVAWNEIDTGYKYAENVSPEILVLDLTCGYVLSGLKHMELTRQLIERSEDFQETKMVVASYRHVAKFQVATLFDLGVRDMNQLWTLYLYLTITVDGREVLDHTRPEKLLKDHDNVIAKLQDLAGKCQPGNRFTWTEPANMVTASALVTENIREINQLLRRNADSARLTLEGSTVTTIERWALNDFGSNVDAIEDMMDAFNVQILWDDPVGQLRGVWQKAHSIDSPVMVFGYLHGYYWMCDDFFKIIIMRLAWKHTLYLGNEESVTERQEYVRRWRNILIEFVEFMDMGKDSQLVELLVMFTKKDLDGEKLIDRIRTHIKAILLTVWHVADNPMTLDGKELTLPLKTETLRLIVSNKNTGKGKPIEDNSIAVAKIFVQFLKSVFQNINFQVLRSYTQHSFELIDD